MTLTLIDQSVPPNADSSQPFASTYRCDACHLEFKALTLARAEQHRCGAPVTVKSNAADTAALKQQVAELSALVAKLTKGESEPVAQAEPERVIKKRGRPKKVVEPQT